VKLYKNFFICVLFFSSCVPKNIDRDAEEKTIRETRSQVETRLTDRSSERSVRGEDYRSSELRRLKGSSDPVIRSFLEDRYSGGSYGYGGDLCKEVSSCLDICEETFSSKYRRKCENASAEFIENLEEDLFKLISISDLDEVDISPSFIVAVLEFDEDLLSDLVKQNMSEGDLKIFLAWVAVNNKVSEAFAEDSRAAREILSQAFERLGEFNDGKDELETGLNIGLIGEDDTFFSLASDEVNEEGFALVYRILENACSNESCKLEVLCSREKQTTSRSSRIFGSSRSISVSTCKTSTRTDRRIRSTGETCYIQGSSVWSFLEELIEDEQIRDSDFDDNDTVTVEKCNRFCGSVSDNNKKCHRIL